MGSDHLVKRVIHFIVFGPAAIGSVLGKETLFHEIGNSVGLAPYPMQSRL